MRRPVYELSTLTLAILSECAIVVAFGGRGDDGRTDENAERMSAWLRKAYVGMQLVALVGCVVYCWAEPFLRLVEHGTQARTARERGTRSSEGKAAAVAPMSVITTPEGGTGAAAGQGTKERPSSKADPAQGLRLRLEEERAALQAERQAHLGCQRQVARLAVSAAPGPAAEGNGSAHAGACPSPGFAPTHPPARAVQRDLDKLRQMTKRLEGDKRDLARLVDKLSAPDPAQHGQTDAAELKTRHRARNCATQTEASPAAGHWGPCRTSPSRADVAAPAIAPELLAVDPTSSTSAKLASELAEARKLIAQLQSPAVAAAPASTFAPASSPTIQPMSAPRLGASPLSTMGFREGWRLAPGPTQHSAPASPRCSSDVPSSVCPAAHRDWPGAGAAPTPLATEGAGLVCSPPLSAPFAVGDLYGENGGDALVTGVPSLPLDLDFSFIEEELTEEDRLHLQSVLPKDNVFCSRA